ncbi:oxaloacetate decarboxylase subunit alpha [Maledivibacter halophilus]|uniref:Oxaloacetate decarboxylase, alpha subunit n=1 Tax=Maledivibacter halophilus TaxID=36842 RepID=A0A1T5JG29_9FIRM|nr:oxaloacetate decarboxylase subunit alpha [Maledivibacter halophilus]SKC50192.1 oxaloacetate decarboxylase, alpha subunit [Maledivibacter halophilus]
MSKVKITETILRDAHQSLIATRLKIKEILPILEELDKVGYNALEMWGGATFDTCLRFLNEDPWERLRAIRRKVKRTKLQMLMRGQNVLGYKHYSDDIVIDFVKKAVYNGIDIIRIFDALNDIRNIKVALEMAKKEGVHAQGAIAYTISPVHTIQTYIDLAKEMENMGADSICIKDMSGLLTPFFTFELISSLKKTVNIPLELHSHSTSGLASMSYLKGIEAGVDIIDTAISPFALGTSQPPTESIVAALEATEFDTELNINKLNTIAEYFKPLREKYIENGLLNPKVFGVNINTLIYQVPGGMLSNLINQLQAQKALDKFDEVLGEVPRVREDLGYPPLVTPTSQIIGTQAVLNIITGERYKVVPKEVKAYVKGMYGKPTVPIKEKIVRKIIGGEKVITCRPADLLEPQLEVIKNEIKEYLEKEEDVLTYALFPQVALKYFKYREAKKYNVDDDLTDSNERTYPI